MDTDTLVEQGLPEQKFTDGCRLLQELDREGLEVTVAVWARVGENERWRLFIATKEAETDGLAAVYRKIYVALRALPTPLLSSLDIRGIEASEPFARDALEARGQHTGPGPLLFQGWRLGDMPVHSARFYFRLLTT